MKAKKHPSFPSIHLSVHASASKTLLTHVHMHRCTYTPVSKLFDLNIFLFISLLACPKEEIFFLAGTTTLKISLLYF